MSVLLIDSEEVKTFQPPSEIMKKAYLAGNVNETELSTRTLLPVEELHMHLEAMNEITERRKEGAKKAMATRKKKVKCIHIN